MESNIHDVNNLDSEVLLPPRKRLLAGLKKQNSEAEAMAAALDLSSLARSPVSVTDRVNIVLDSYLKDRTMSPEVMSQVSRSAAAAAAMAAEAAKVAKSVAEEKAALAVKAIELAKSALHFVVKFPEGGATQERSSKKNKLKKHVPVQQLYRKRQKTDEELARKLHREFNSSARISKKMSSSNMRDLKLKKSKGSLSGSSRVPDEVVSLEGGQDFLYNGQAEVVIDGEAGSSRSKEKSLEDACLNGKKKGRGKLKKLLLTICNDRDQANPKLSPPSAERNRDSPTADDAPLSPPEQAGNAMPVEASSTWTCQNLEAPACVDKNKVM